MHNDLIQLIQDADLALLQMDQAKSAVEKAKLEFDLAKEEFDRVLGRADELGIARGKLRKLAEERSAALLASGLLSTPANSPFGSAVKASAAKTGRSKNASRSAPPLQESSTDGPTASEGDLTSVSEATLQ